MCGGDQSSVVIYTSFHLTVLLLHSTYTYMYSTFFLHTYQYMYVHVMSCILYSILSDIVGRDTRGIPELLIRQTQCLHYEYYTKKIEQ